MMTYTDLLERFPTIAELDRDALVSFIYEVGRGEGMQEALDLWKKVNAEIKERLCG